MDIGAPDGLPSGPSRPGAFARFLRRRKPLCFLLEEGIRPAELRCTLCGSELALPHREGRRFELASPRATRAIRRSRHFDGTRLAIDGRMLVTGVNLHLIPLLERAKAFLGEKVLVAKAPRHGTGRRQPYVFCARCGASLVARVSRENERRYSWDWLAEIEPRGGVERWQVALSGVGRYARREMRRILPQSLVSRPRPHRAGLSS